jgi:hypothetical protein
LTALSDTGHPFKPPFTRRRTSSQSPVLALAATPRSLKYLDITRAAISGSSAGSGFLSRGTSSFSPNVR